MKLDPNQKTVTLTNQTLFPHYSSKADQSIVSMISLKAPEIDDEDGNDKRKPIDIVCVVDISGSMEGEKLNLVKETLVFMAKEMKGEDRMSIVTYSDDARVHIGLTKMDTAGQEEMKKSIGVIHTEGCTNLCDGLMTGLEVIRNRKEKNDIAAVLLFTDGLANVGVTNVDEIVNIMKGLKSYECSSSEVPKSTGKGFNYTTLCSVHTFGFGQDHEGTYLNSIASCANGVYFYIDTAEVIPQAFIACLGGLLSVVCQNLKLNVEAVGDHTITRVWSGYTYECIKEKKEYQIAMHDLQSEEQRDIIFEINAPKLDTPHDNQPYIKYTLTYVNMTAGEKGQMETRNLIGFVSRPEETEAKQEPNTSVDKEFSRLKATEMIKVAVELGNIGKFDEAKEKLSSVKKEIMVSSACDDCDVLLNDLSACENELTESNWSRGGEQQFNNIYSGYAQQRSAGLSKESHVMYANKKKVKMLSRFKSS